MQEIHKSLFCRVEEKVIISPAYNCFIDIHSCGNPVFNEEGHDDIIQTPAQ